MSWYCWLGLAALVFILLLIFFVRRKENRAHRLEKLRGEAASIVRANDADKAYLLLQCFHDLKVTVAEFDNDDLYHKLEQLANKSEIDFF